MINLTETALRRPITTLMVFLSMVVIGMIAAGLLPLEFMPDMEFPNIFVRIPYPGATPEEVERQITRPVEEVLATISGLQRMESDSEEDGAGIRLEFDWGQDTKLKAVEVREKIDGIRHQLPEDLERYFVWQWSSTDWEILALRISSNRDLSNSYDMLNRNLKRRIERLNGVSRVELYGVDKKEIRIQLIANRVAAHQVDLNELAATLRQSNFSVTAGKITDTGRRFVVRPIGEFQAISDIGDLLVNNNNVRLKDIANVVYDHPRRDYGRHLDRRYAIGLEVYKEAGANIVEVTERINEEIEKIKLLPEMEGISIFYMDSQAEGILSSLNELLKSGLLGAALAFLVLFFFLRRWSSTFIVALAVPFSLLVTLGLMFFFEISLNILSMMGLMLAVGMLVDNAVVVTESIHRHQLSNEEPTKAALTGVKEVSLAITAGTLTTAIVFLPGIISPKDEISTYMKFVSITIITALAASLLIAQTVVPLLASRLKAESSVTKATIIDKLIEKYALLLNWTIHHPKTSAGIILLVLCSVLIPAKFVKQDMFPPQGDRQLRLFYHVNGKYALEKVEGAVDVVEEYLYENKEKFEIRSVYSYYNTGWASSTILLTRDDKVKKSQEKIREEIRENLPKLAIANPTFDWRRPGGNRDAIRVQLIGKSSQLLAEISRDIAWLMSKIPGFKDVKSEAEIGEREVQVVVDRERARRYGLSTSEVANLIAVSMRGTNLRKLRDEEGEIDVRVEFRDDDRQTMHDLKNLPLFNNRGEMIKLAALANFELRDGPRTIHREDRVTAIGVSANLDDLTKNEAREKIQKVLSTYNFPPGYSWNFGQNFSYEEETGKMMLTNTVLALILIYLVMAALFESLLYPAAIWTSIILPLSECGGFLWPQELSSH